MHADLSAAAIERATSKAIHDLGSTWMLHGETMARAKDQGYENPFAFYFAGRGGVLGDVDAEVVVAAFGWFAPAVVRPLWEAGVAVHGARPAASRYYAACAEWGRDHLDGVDGLDRFVELGAPVVEAAERSGRPLFAGWSGEARAEDPAGASLQLVHVLREWRGANHLVATTAVGLSPLEAVLTDPEGQAHLFGWTEPWPEVTSDLRRRGQEARDLTDRLCAVPFEVLTPAERSDFVELVNAMFAAGTT